MDLLQTSTRPSDPTPLERGDAEGLKNQILLFEFLLDSVYGRKYRTVHGRQWDAVQGKRKVWPLLSRPFQRVRLVSAVGGRRGRGGKHFAFLKGWVPADFLMEQMSGVSRQRMLPLVFVTKQKSGVSRLRIACPPAAMKSAGPTPVLREGGDMRLRTPGWCPFGVFGWSAILGAWGSRSGESALRAF